MVKTSCFCKFDRNVRRRHQCRLQSPGRLQDLSAQVQIPRDPPLLSTAHNLGGPWPCAAHQPRAGLPHLTRSSQAGLPLGHAASLSGAAASLSSVPEALTRWAWGHRKAPLPLQGQRHWLPVNVQPCFCHHHPTVITAKAHFQPQLSEPYSLSEPPLSWMTSQRLGHTTHKTRPLFPPGRLIPSPPPAPIAKQKCFSQVQRSKPCPLLRSPFAICQQILSFKAILNPTKA